MIGQIGRTGFDDRGRGIYDIAGREEQLDARVRGQDVAGYVDLALTPWPRLALRGGVRLDGNILGVPVARPGSGSGDGYARRRGVTLVA